MSLLEKMKHVKINGEDIPYMCTISTLADLQEEYGSIEKFEKELLGIVETDKNGIATKTKEPSIKAAVFGLSLMIESGVRKHNKNSDDKIEFRSSDVADVDMTPEEIKKLVHRAFVESIQVKKEIPPQE